jgi:hypothetical protein
MKRLLALLVLLAACSDEKPPAAAAKPKTPPPPAMAVAQALLTDAAELAEFEFTNAAFTMPVATAAASEPVRDGARQLAKAGWLELDSAGNASLASKASGDKRFLVRPNGTIDIVPLAKKELGSVTAVRSNPDGTAAVDFTWRWLPNEVGAAFTTGPVAERFTGDQKSTATLIWDGTSWSILKIER